MLRTDDRRRLGRRPDSQTANASGINVENLELDTGGMTNYFTALGNAAEQREDQAAHCVDLAPLVVGQDAADLLLEKPDGCAAVDVDRTVDTTCDRRRLRHVVLVLDFTHDLLDEILDGEEPVGAAELVDHQRHVRARAAHIEQHVEHRQGRRDENDAAKNIPQIELLGGAPVGQHVLDVDHADHIIERLAIDRVA